MCTKEASEYAQQDGTCNDDTYRPWISSTVSFKLYFTPILAGEKSGTCLCTMGPTTKADCGGTIFGVPA